MSAVLPLVRLAVAAAVALAAVAAVLAALVQRRVFSPFGRPARLIRDWTDRVIKPIERRILRAGGNPQSAPWWLAGVAILLGIVAVTAIEWAAGEARVLAAAARGGGRPLAAQLADWAISLLMIALVVRVVGSWLGAGRYTRWMRPFWALTEWFLAPLRRVLPPLGPFDLSPLVAWFALSLLRQALFARQ